MPPPLSINISQAVAGPASSAGVGAPLGTVHPSAVAPLSGSHGQPQAMPGIPAPPQPEALPHYFNAQSNMAEAPPDMLFYPGFYISELQMSNDVPMPVDFVQAQFASDL